MKIQTLFLSGAKVSNAMAYKTLFSKVREKRGRVGPKKSANSKERAKTGFEVEFLIVDEEGNVANAADKILSKIESEDLKHEAVKECAHSYVEMNVYPRIYVRNVATKFLGDMEGVLDVAEKFDLSFYPLAMFPYDYEPKMREGGWYGVKEKIFGGKWHYAGRCAGFHLHYSLPTGIFSYDDRHLAENPKRSEKQKTINSYNFAIAIDPALTTFTQSSPIYKGRIFAKDSRLLLYRGGDDLGYDGLYSNYPLFGGLEPYIITYDELISRGDLRYGEWIKIVKGAGGDVDALKDKNRLDFAWNPIKINKVGSIELRNMDMNMPSTLMAISILVKYVFRDIQRKEIEVISDDSAIQEPFRYEDGDKPKIYIPPFWHVKSVLQKESAIEGLVSDEMHTYCKRFFSLCLRFANKKYYPMLKPVKSMLKNKKTRSDEIISFVKKRGHGMGHRIDDEILREIVLKYSGGLKKDIIDTKKRMESLSEDERTWL